jgi:hypothetical protein
MSNTGEYVRVSDRNFKKNISPLTQCDIQKVLELQPVSFQMKSDTEGKYHAGFIAQDVKEVIPSLVTSLRI